MDKMLATVEPEIRALEVYLALNGIHLWDFAFRDYSLSKEALKGLPLYIEVKKRFRKLHPGCEIRLHFGVLDGIKSPTNTYWIIEGSSKYPLVRRKSGNVIKMCVPIGKFLP